MTSHMVLWFGFGLTNLNTVPANKFFLFHFVLKVFSLFFRLSDDIELCDMHIVWLLLCNSVFYCVDDTFLRFRDILV